MKEMLLYFKLRANAKGSRRERGKCKKAGCKGHTTHVSSRADGGCRNVFPLLGIGMEYSEGGGISVVLNEVFRD